MSKKILIANRGEIALRALRACKELDLKTVAIYSSGDKELKHLRLADETVCVGPASPLESYLNIPAILSAAELTSADAIYPGYGFLAEDADFAERCEASGFIFIGPSSEVIRQMGDKITAKDLAEKSDIPIVPGYKGDLPENDDAIKKIAADVGYPLMIKASAGGGGRGMRVVTEESELISSMQLTKQEAKNAFGNDTLYFEKFIQNPRHIEVQIVADGKGNAIHLGTRDCSMQRRHQKIIEEAPAMNVSQEALDKTLEACLTLCRNIAYSGVGTLEFLYEDGQFYFIEMNTRIQVEHPVSEMITGFDIVKAQLKIALGINLTLKQEKIIFRGHAIECRINAEDPYTGFRPSPGKITNLHLPGGHGVRLDTHVYSGYVIPPNYDSMIAKLIVTAQNRKEAIQKMKRALDEFIIEGIKTTIPFHRQLMDDEDYISGNYTTKFMEEFEIK